MIQISAEEWLNILQIKRRFIWELIERLGEDSKGHKILEKAADDYTQLICDLIKGVNNDET